VFWKRIVAFQIISGLR